MGEFRREPRDPAVRSSHGNAWQYRHGCRCEPCRANWSRMQRDRRARVKRGEGDFLVSAELCREHLFWLSEQHVGKDAVAAVTGIDVVRLWQIRAGRTRRVRMSTEARIMAVTPDARCDGSWVSGRETSRRIDELLKRGYTLSELGRLLGYAGKHDGIQFYRKPRVTALNAMRVEKLHRRLMGQSAEHMMTLAAAAESRRRTLAA